MATEPELKNYHPLTVGFQKRTWYRYYDTPDGQDFTKKLWYTTKLGMKTGYLFGGFYALALQNKNLSRFWLFYDFFMGAAPFVIASTTYTVTTFCLTEYRKKDDELNAQLGGAAAGLIFGSWFRKPGLAVALTIAGGFLCGLKKISVMDGFRFPDQDCQREVDSSWVLRKLDFTLTKEYPGNWTKIRPVPPEPPPPPLPPPPPPPPPPSICDHFQI